MLRSIKKIDNYVLQAENGEIGRCKDFLFDDRLWVIRYMVADTGKWLPERQVLLSPISFGEPDWDSKTFPVRLTKEQIEEAPGIEENAPVSRQHEMLSFQHYGWSYYWNGAYAWGVAAYPGMLYDKENPPDKSTKEDLQKNHLRSVDEVRGYRIQTIDDEVGHVVDFIVDDETWVIHYMVVDTRNWLPGKKVLVPPDWIKTIDWAKSKVSVDLTIDKIKSSPKYDSSKLIHREFEERLYEHYDQPKYWE